jgi:hypothetical protein
MRMPNHFEYVHGHLSKRALATLRISPRRMRVRCNNPPRLVPKVAQCGD